MTPILDPARAARAADALSEGRTTIRPGSEPATYVVASFTGDGSYLVDLERATCTCPDHRIRGGTCKHRIAVLLRRGLT